MAQTAAVASRRLRQGWIESFVERTAHFPSPEIIRIWAGISAVAGVLERKVWVHTAGNDLYPNVYVILVTRPGIGKTLMLNEVERLWREIPELHVAPTSLTRASLIDSLAEANRKVVTLLGGLQINAFNSLQIVSGELGVLIPAWDNDFMNTLTAIYDGAGYDERRRTAKLHLKIEKPQLNILAATTPSYLNTVMPEGAWDQGFISRTILVFSSEHQLMDIFNDVDRGGQQDLIYDLKTIFSLQGEMSWTNDARDIVRDWHLKGGAPAPEHPKLSHYSSRRTAHLIKLCMIACASRANDMTISMVDVGAAFEWLFSVEKSMPEIFMAVSSGGDKSVIEDARGFVASRYAATKEPVPEFLLVGFLKNRVQSHNLMRIIEVMLRSHMIGLVPSKSGPAYVPLTGDK